MSGERHERQERDQRPDVRQAAREYVKRGWRVVKLRPRSKAPAQRAWPKLRIGEEEIDATFPPESNIGLALGSASGGPVDVDLDTVEAQIAAQRLMPFTPMMVGHTGGIEHGWYTHLFYQVVGDLPRTEKFQAPRGLATEAPRETGMADALETPNAEVAEVAEVAAPETTGHTTSIAELRADGH